MQRKLKHLKKYIYKTDIFCVQEAHGDWALLRKHLGDVLVKFWAFCTFYGSSNKGGLITFVSKEACPNFDDIHEEVFVQGRVLLSCYITGPRRFSNHIEHS